MKLAEAVDQYVANAGYTTLEQAQKYQAAIRVLIVLRPTATTIGGESVSFNSSVLASELERVGQFIRNANTAGTRDNRVRTYDHSTLRS